MPFSDYEPKCDFFGFSTNHAQRKPFFRTTLILNFCVYMTTEVAGLLHGISVLPLVPSVSSAGPSVLSRYCLPEQIVEQV